MPANYLWPNGYGLDKYVSDFIENVPVLRDREARVHLFIRANPTQKPKLLPCYTREVRG